MSQQEHAVVEEHHSPENLFPPIPSEAILPLAGFTASRGEDEPDRGDPVDHRRYVVGAFVLHYLGAALGRDRTRAAVAVFIAFAVAAFIATRLVAAKSRRCKQTDIEAPTEEFTRPLL